MIEKRIRPNQDDEGDTWVYNRAGDIATLRVDLSRFADPENAADRLLMACDELAGMIYDQGANQ